MRNFAIFFLLLLNAAVLRYAVFFCAKAKNVITKLYLC